MSAFRMFLAVSQVGQSIADMQLRGAAPRSLKLGSIQAGDFCDPGLWNQLLAKEFGEQEKAKGNAKDMDYHECHCVKHGHGHKLYKWHCPIYIDEDEWNNHSPTLAVCEMYREYDGGWKCTGTRHRPNCSIQYKYKFDDDRRLKAVSEEAKAKAELLEEQKLKEQKLKEQKNKTVRSLADGYCKICKYDRKIAKAWGESNDRVVNYKACKCADSGEFYQMICPTYSDDDGNDEQPLFCSMRMSEDGGWVATGTEDNTLCKLNGAA